MKIFFDTNVYIAEALLGATAELLLETTQKASWRIHACEYLLDEIERVLVNHLEFSQRLAFLTRRRVLQRVKLVDPGSSRHHVQGDDNDSPILQAAIAAGSDYLVTNDRHLLELDPYEGLKIISMAKYHELLIQEGLMLQ